MKPRKDLFLRDGRELRRRALEIMRQVEFYEANCRKGAGSELRFIFIAGEAKWLLKAARRAAKRYNKEQGRRQSRDET